RSYRLRRGPSSSASSSCSTICGRAIRPFSTSSRVMCCAGRHNTARQSGPITRSPVEEQMESLAERAERELNDILARFAAGEAEVVRIFFQREHTAAEY